MTEFENVKSAFTASSIFSIFFGLVYILFGLFLELTSFSYLIACTILPFSLILFVNYRKKQNPLYQLDYVSRKKILKHYYLFEPKMWMSFASLAVIALVIVGFYFLVRDFMQAGLIGLGLLFFLNGTISLIFTHRMTPSFR